MPLIISLALVISCSVASAQPVGPSHIGPNVMAQSTGIDREEASEAPIQDNSFLIEEAYNQEAGVIQHISAFQRMRSTGDWVYTFTQEWPVPGQQHQLSLTVPYERIHASADGRSAIGDAAINYRYQLAGNGKTRLAVAPRFSLLLPAGDASQSRGAGAVGYQANIPVSYVLNRAFVTHVNAGVTVTPGSRNARGDRADTTAWNVGQSLVWLARPRFNALVEAVYTHGQVVAAPGIRQLSETFFVNPGVRWALNFKSGLQVVPGVSIPIGVGPSAGERALFLYLSFEHPLWNAR